MQSLIQSIDACLLIDIMNKSNYLDLDGRSLRTLLTVLETLSVSKAAARLNVTQSAVSHTLAKLRTTFGDPLFVRSGRGIAATEPARALREPVRALLDDLKALSDPREFDPTSEPLRFVIGANDFQRDLIFPSVLRRAHNDQVDLRLRFMPSGVPEAAVLREARCDLLVTPFPPSGPDILQSRLFEDRLACFFDASVAPAPPTLGAFRKRAYAEVRFNDNQRSLVALSNIDTSKLPEPRVSVPNFSALASFIQGTDMIATELSLMALGPLRGLDTAALPFKTRPIVMYLAWHRRDHDDPAHQWLRGRVRRTVQATMASMPAKTD